MAELNSPPQPSKKRGRPPGRRVSLNGDKESRKQNFMKKILDDDKATKTASFYKRKPTLMKKAEEIRTLCDVSVCVVCFAPNGSVDVWPEDEQCAKEVMWGYQRLQDKERKETNVLDFLRHKKQKLEKKVQQVKLNTLVSALPEYIDGLSESTQLMDFVNELEGKVKSLKERMEIIRSENKGKITREENIEENFENLFIPIDHPPQNSYVHDALPFSVWQPTTEPLLNINSSN
ncbi:agamous-like MADS-box protein AGL103 [Mercurialis annua]|uniref:agamous-like MADS-box protein AGL103 n=1 Tax=Mercurialis annua TaxID=3986 RepID=UPI00215FDA1A|nr:agamous-like MADS-box protein AGL103 [Mercurialis annua]